MHTYIISDLHLTPERPKTIKAFFDFLANDAPTAERLYILGDLFEFWIGDDAGGILGADPILDAMKTISQVVDCYFIAGNRDFLVRETFTDRTGFKILNDETVIDLYGTKTLLLHGDSLCTDDIAHQQFRSQMMTNDQFCNSFLQMNIGDRIEQAKQARQQSKQHKSAISMGIMDVTEAAVLASFAKHTVSQMIHGHTHRQNTHQYDVDGDKATRYVLDDWHVTSSIMRVDKDGINIFNAPI
ncbi:MAG: UDP-2,3-diacylglucosamine diphosphatase [Arenicella sp.]|nr:UDP-2,3-diacylglucosamine diphosphatase [Arenicella sp.]